MSIETIPTAEDDLNTVLEAYRTGRPIPDDVSKRVDERAKAARERIFRDHGFIDVVTPIRESRESGH